MITLSGFWSNMNSIQKKQFEQFLITVNFNNRFEILESIASYTVTGIETSSGRDDSLSIFFFEDTVYQDTDIAYGDERYGGVPDNTGTSVTFGIKDGESDTNYKITVKVTTTLGNIYEEDLILQIKNKGDVYFTKQPSERFLVLMDFTHTLNKNDIRYDDTIQNQTVTATKTSNGTDATGLVVYSSAIDDETKVRIIHKSGTDGEIYRITTKIVTVQGYQYQMDVLMSAGEK